MIAMDQDVRDTSRELLALAGDAATDLPPTYGFVADELRATSDAIVRALAHDDKETLATKAGRMSAILDIAHACDVVDAGDHARGKRLCLRFFHMVRERR